MCTTCGCGGGEPTIEGGHAHAPDHHHHHHHHHAHGHAHGHAHPHRRGHAHQAGDARAPGDGSSRLIELEQDILAANAAHAARNRRFLAERGILALNLVSSPGSGKTTLLTRTVRDLRERMSVAVIEGDQQTTRDAERIRATGVPAIQINTGKGCHLDAHMVGHALERLPCLENSLLLIENVGNLVCPSAFDLGEAHKVVILSVTEGEDKPLKYPDMFHASSLMLMNKSDLLPHLDFDVAECAGFARRVNPDIQMMQISAARGDGFDSWLNWIEQERAAHGGHARAAGHTVPVVDVA